MPSKHGFILHQYPTLHLDEKGDPYYARIPEEELYILDGVDWPVVNDHIYKEDGSIDVEAETARRDYVGTAKNPVTKGGYLYTGNAQIDLPEKKWAGKEFSTVYSAYHEKLEEPYTWIDTEGKIGKPGKEYLIEKHHRDIRPVSLALVEKGRFGNNVAVREPNNKYLVANSAVEFKEKPMATSKTAEKPTSPHKEEVTVNNAEETPAPDLTPEVDQAALAQSITQEILKEGGAAAQFFAEQISKINDVVAKAETKIGELVANAVTQIPAKEETAEPSTEEDRPLTANAVEEIFKKCLGKADLSTPHTTVANASEKPLSFAQQIEANSKL